MEMNLSEHRSEPAPARQGPSYFDRLQACKTAFLSCPRSLQSVETTAAVRHRFPSIRIRTYDKFVEPGEQWSRELLASGIDQIDLLIIVTNDDRNLTSGVVREIYTAKGAGKLLVIFNVSNGRWERYYGWARSKRMGTRCGRCGRRRDRDGTRRRPSEGGKKKQWLSYTTAN